MPKATPRNERDGVSDREAVDDVADILLRLVGALDANGHTLDDVYQSFRELDVKNRGVLSSSVYALCQNALAERERITLITRLPLDMTRLEVTCRPSFEPSCRRASANKCASPLHHLRGQWNHLVEASLHWTNALS